MVPASIEFLVEPFRENDPGPHVHAVVDAVRRAGLDTEMGPFATTAEGDLDTVVAAVGDLLRAGFAAGATSIALRVRTHDDDTDPR